MQVEQLCDFSQRENSLGLAAQQFEEIEGTVDDLDHSVYAAIGTGGTVITAERNGYGRQSIDAGFPMAILMPPL